HLSFLYAAGCFRRDTLINFATATSRLAVALGFSAVVLLVLMHFVMGQIFPDAIIFRSVSRSATVAFLGMGVSLCGPLQPRAFFRHGAPPLVPPPRADRRHGLAGALSLQSPQQRFASRTHRACVPA